MEANILKRAVVGFDGSEEMKQFGWKWAGEKLPVQSSYTDLGVVFSDTCKWDLNLDAIAGKELKALSNYFHVLKSKQLTIPVRLALLTRAIRLVLEYANKVWEPIKGEDEKLEQFSLRGRRGFCSVAPQPPPLR